MSFDDLTFRSIILKFAVDDLLNRNDDAVAISCDRTFSLTTGIGRAFGNRGGRPLMNDIAPLRNQHPQISAPLAALVRGSGLNCQNLILAPVRQFFRNNFEDVFLEIFQCAIQNGITSLALPPIGTGGFNMNRVDVAQAMRSAFETQYNFGSLTQITIVDNSAHSVRYFRNMLENMIEDDLQTNPNFYTSNNPQTPLVVAAQTSDGVVSPFSTFYTAKELSELKEMREKRLEDKMMIDTPNRDEEEQLEACPVCLADMMELDENYTTDSDFTVVQLNRCPHLFHRRCLISWFQNKSQCPICNTWYMVQNGNQPINGTMQDDVVNGRLPGYASSSHIRIIYTFPNGIQGAEHPRPGVPYKGTRRTCYLPDNNEGHEILTLLKEAFNRRLVFTVGDSVTTGQQNVVTWNGIHHKTNRNGGPANYGFPDTTYLQRVKSELAAIGITDHMLQVDTTMDDDDDDNEEDSSDED